MRPKKPRIICGMNRVRLSTTVDGQALTRARRLKIGSDAELVDAALNALIRNLEAERDLAALDSWPYADDAELEMPDALHDHVDALPYLGSVPTDVERLARLRRART